MCLQDPCASLKNKSHAPLVTIFLKFVKKLLELPCIKPSQNRFFNYV